MTRRLLDIGVGARAALRSPLWVRGSRLQRLLRGVPAGSRGARRPEVATRTSLLALRVLAHIPLLPWRNTCLYRSVAECLVLQSCGIGCRLQLGVSHDSASGHSIVAHAWVERPDRAPADSLHVPLRPSQ